MSEWEWYRRLHAIRPRGALGRGYSAEVADPIWFLGRQWQLGEHQGEDLSSPVLAEVDVSHHRLAPLLGPPDGDLDPTVVPAEALLEAGPDDWWTLGRRVRLGQAVAAAVPAGQLGEDVRFGPLPAPYEAFRGAVDGRAAYAQAIPPRADPVWAEVPSTVSADHWRPDTLTFGATFRVGNVQLRADNHDGGDVDWYTVDADQALDPAAATANQKMYVITSRLQYPGAPLPRWWQIEDAHVDIGGFAPDRTHWATTLLLEASVSHTDDWFTFPVPSPGGDDALGVGVVVTLNRVQIKDSFDDWSVPPVPPGRGDAPPPDGARPWSVFRTRGLDRTSLVVWPTAVAPLSGPLLDDIVMGVDEDANLLWAVEMRAEGLELAPDAQSLAAQLETTPSGTRQFRYLPSTSLPPYWHPYRIEARGAPPQRRFVQGLVADLNAQPPAARDGPRSSLLGGAPGKRYGVGHELAAWAVPNVGLRLERRWTLARRTNGQPCLWVKRQRVPLFGGPISWLRFDVLAEAPEAPPP